jgi:Xaa-Pro aminopeptidase
VAAVKESLPLFHSGKSEMEIAHVISSGFKAHGCEGDSFPPIVATGGNGSILHHEAEPEAMLQHGQAVVTDVGCYKGHYASDFSRTLPVGGRFQPQARTLYAAVYQAQQAAAQACRPGAYLTDRGSPDGGSLEAVSRAALAAKGVDSRYGHRIGHTVGLLVHDVPATGPLQEGMVVTLEPGLYIDGELGIRIEDMFLVTDGGCELLTTGFPADPDTVERMASEAFAPQDAGVVERIVVPDAGVDGGVRP